MYHDSINKIVSQLSAVSLIPVNQYTEGPVKKIVIAPSMFRTFICKAGCGSCCSFPVTKDWLPAEQRPAEAAARTITVNGEEFTVYTVESSKPCQFFSTVLKCTLWPAVPVLCDGSPNVNFLKVRDITYIQKRPFGRAWTYPKTPECQFLTVLPANFDREINILSRYLSWADYLKIPTVIPAIITVLKNWDHKTVRYEWEI